MIVTKLPLDGLLLIQPKIFTDERGYFFESFNDKAFTQHIDNTRFVQDNESYSTYGVLRGLHFQTGEHVQAKLVRVIQGKVFDVAVDLRPDSLTFGKYYATELSSENKTQLFIPRGFAHGFLTLSKDAVLQYKCDNYYCPEAERGIHFLDTKLAIKWPIETRLIKVNDRDNSFLTLKDYISHAR